jgi:hypothetical protein
MLLIPTQQSPLTAQVVLLLQLPLHLWLLLLLLMMALAVLTKIQGTTSPLQLPKTS